MIKVNFEVSDEQLLDVVAFVKANKITAVFEGALLLEVGKKYKTREGKIVTIESEDDEDYLGDNSKVYYANGRHFLAYEDEFDLIEEVKEELPFEMVVGGVYEMRNGKIEKIVEEGDDNTYPFYGTSGRCYTKEGAWIKGKEHGVDLIKRIK